MRKTKIVKKKLWVPSKRNGIKRQEKIPMNEFVYYSHYIHNHKYTDLFMSYLLPA